MELQRLDVCPPLVIIEFASLEGRDVSWIGYPALDLRIDQTGNCDKNSFGPLLTRRASSGW